MFPFTTSFLSHVSADTSMTFTQLVLCASAIAMRGAHPKLELCLLHCVVF